MPFINTDISGLFVFEPRVFGDNRGHFFEAYNEEIFKEVFSNKFVQDNQSYSRKGVIRGLHYQLPPFAQTKLVRVVSGQILDVAVDIRKGSPTFGKVFAIELSAANKKQLLIPQGFAHGFSVLSDEAEVLYKCDSFYNKEHDAGIRFNDSTFGIDWQVPVNDAIVSEKDLQLPDFANCRNSFAV